MKFSKSDQSQQIFSFSTSVLIHALLLLGAYYCMLVQPMATAPATSYSVQLSKSAPSPKKSAPALPEANKAQQESPVRKKKHAAKPAPKRKPRASTTANKAKAKKKVADTKKPEEKKPQKKDVDRRSLYTNDTNQSVGAVLEIVGWTWDTVPQPQDDTEESGKIVFEITIDDLGEVVAVKTLEKTVSPVVEQIYKDALIALTFSRTADNASGTQNSTGKVTFILKAN